MWTNIRKFRKLSVSLLQKNTKLGVLAHITSRWTIRKSISSRYITHSMIVDFWRWSFITKLYPSRTKKTQRDIFKSTNEVTYKSQIQWIRKNKMINQNLEGYGLMHVSLQDIIPRFSTSTTPTIKRVIFALTV